MTWRTGNRTSGDDKDRAFLERDDDGKWWDGRLLEGFPLLHEEPFDSVESYR